MTEHEKPEQPESSEEPPVADDSVADDPVAESPVSESPVSGKSGDVAEKAGAKPISPADYPPPPPASFEVLLSMMFTQAMSMLGQIPDPTTGQTTINKPFAKHSIDTLEMLGEKTKGNLTDDEAKMLSEAMHALRMAYVSVRATST